MCCTSPSWFPGHPVTVSPGHLVTERGIHATSYETDAGYCNDRATAGAGPSGESALSGALYCYGHRGRGAGDLFCLRPHIFIGGLALWRGDRAVGNVPVDER